ncbi:substrate-binding domain-containing protein [Asanoa sp. WMMD1127]|uniref:substrate-binding domain-containing protein n=1 Tax=Asanoa sp. WMMD1127 TaxID=3016107 RepID=UPI0024181141|nr:substrate-binding domain-containing protein [Asanoa sp. WMMD1127]MDG4821713.1 substrate-binding domain-containing protein [Asanoa sp. WMMD1127]
MTDPHSTKEIAIGRATLATVARLAGVSVTTVSKVVNGRCDVGAETRALVESLLEQHDYIGRRSRAARGNPATAQIELVLTCDLNAYSTEIIQGVLDASGAASIAVAISTRPRTAAGADASHPIGWARDLAAAGRRAVIAVLDDLTSTDLAALSRAHLPLVVIDPLNLQRQRAASVGSTNFAGGMAAAQHLLALGHRRIGYVGDSSRSACNQARMHGYRAALEAAGVPVPDDHRQTGDFRYQDGIAGGAAQLDLPKRPTAVFASSDEMAAGVIEAARARGLRVPDDLSVVGFDDTEVARLFSPPLTTVRQPLREMGGVALRTALRVAAGEKLDSHHVELATELIVRGSTAAR